ncbi:MAG TPA: HAMP domain-containing sensor histidine kinase [Myxococcaceae bacterium]|nr:HAMP domain-containing sensor histidine kinase [Myxococcaceae bacterium]
MRLPRRSLRLRLALLYSGLFLASGALLLGVVYGLVAHNLKSSAQTTAAADRRLLQCKQASSAGKLGGTPNVALQQQCRQFFEAGAAQQRTSTLSHLVTYSLSALGAMALVSAVLGWVVAGRALRPLQVITEAARRASHTNLDERLDLRGPPGELKELADTFDAMLDRLDAAFASQRRFVANASHELRTPLTVMRTAVDVTLAKPSRSTEQLEEMAGEIRTAIDQAEGLIEALLTLARSDRGLSNSEPVDLATAAEDALDSAAPGIARAGLEVHAVFDPAPTSGDPVLLERLAANLVDNAVRHNVSPGWIRVTTGERDGSAFLDVSNTGPPIPPDLAGLLFEPFRRLDPTPSGNAADRGVGLGLAIVASVASAHGGSATATSRAQGGLDVVVTLPGGTQKAPTLPENEKG